ncbi:MAG: alanine--tRNA ligase [Candidatus Cloacimonetes bacterium]|nr:alanine--tRNA ligase [Candidatus Cloacimonadota bacterium]
MPPTSNHIRRQFIDFFVQRHGHTAVPSASLIPRDDPTLLFTNAGMNQFKPVFLGLEQPRFARVCDTQKCIRAGGKHNDLEEVGKDGHHHTFFEMLGNWSFADYYKPEAIAWAWELLTEVWKLPKDRLFATVHDSDEEAFNLWRERTDIDPAHIEYHDDVDNFWSMADTGPCGPCSEIHYDTGEQGCDRQGEPGHVCRVNGDCSRYIELWNLVFLQFNREQGGKLNPLAHKYVDTGAGFERIVRVLQHKTSNYETDLFTPILAAIAQMSGVDYDPGEKGVSHRVIADHIRALSFAITDGGMPANEGRGYVLRRILRRAARHGHLLGLRQPFLCKLVDAVIDVMGDHYTELRTRRDHTMQIIRAEEERFNQTLDNGLSRFEEIADALTGGVIPGSDAFMLYDTFGFPLDLTRVMAEERGLRVDEAGFKVEMEKQRQRAREAGKFRLDTTDYDWRELHPDQPTAFAGYDQHTVTAKALKWSPSEAGRVTLVLDTTPFYAESGGQVADTGRVFNDGFEVKVDDVRKLGELWLHEGELLRGEVNGEPATAVIESERRLNVERNHTATHLLHAALRQVLGEHVQQKGSLVHPDHLRFDFTHFRQVTPRELELVEKLVNARVRDCLPVVTRMQSIDEARADGAMALFGEKYDEQVRVVGIEGFSKELCGGTHVDCTGHIGLCKIISETSIAAGVRRLEAITGEHAESWTREQVARLHDVSQALHAPPADCADRAQELQRELRTCIKENEELKRQSAGDEMSDLAQNAREVAGVKLVAARVQAGSSAELRRVGDELRGRLQSGIGVLIADIDGKVSLLALVSKDHSKRCPAGKLVAEIAAIVGGRGGGRPDMAMAGGKDIGKIDEALDQTPAIVQRILED